MRMLLLAALTPVLIPVYYHGPGRFGSQWVTGVSIYNGSSQTIAGNGAEFVVSCPIPEGCFFDTLQPGTSAAIFAPQSERGLLLYLPDDEADEVALQALFASGRTKIDEL
ncbi:MAG: hypothetical protein ACLGH0_04610, partial [Thermoanaerobaculia bacterium]